LECNQYCHCNYIDILFKHVGAKIIKIKPSSIFRKEVQI